MNALTWGDYFGIAIFTIGLYFIGQIIYDILAVIIRVYLNRKKTPPIPTNTLSLLGISHRYEVTMCEVEKALQEDIEQGVITSYTIGDDFILYRQQGGRKTIIDLSLYNVE